MAHLYAVTSHKSTAVNFAVICNFVNKEEKNLILARNNHLKVYTIKEHGLVPFAEIPIFGRIKSLEVYRPATSERDALFVMIERKKICILEFDTATGQVVTKAKSDVQDRIGRDAEVGEKALIDPEGRLVGLLLYTGFIKIVPIDGLSFKESYNLTIEESRLIDVRFLHGCFRPTLCILYEDNNRARHVKTVSIDVRDKELVNGPWSQGNVDYSANLLIPVPSPLNGVVVVGLTSITYLSGTGTIQAVEMSPAQVCSFCVLDEQGTRFLLCDHRGQLTVLVLVVEAGKVVSIVTDIVGTSSIAEAMVHLDNGLVFIGSCLGDSQLVKLHADRLEGGNVEVLDAHKNTGPIVDMVLVENDKSGGQRQLVTCSGAYKDGSLRIVRNGIAIHEQASMEVPGIKSVWSLRESDHAEYDKFLVQSFVTETRILSIEDEEMAEIEISGFNGHVPTLFCANMLASTLVQVTSRGVRVVDCSSHALLQDYRTNRNVTVAKGNLGQLVLALSGGGVVYLEMHPSTRQLVVVEERQLDQDVACLSFRPLLPAGHLSNEGAMDMEGTSFTKETLVAFGMWTDNTVRLLALPSLDEVHRTLLGTETQARDVLLATFDHQTFLFVGMGDGHLITFNVDRQHEHSPPVLANKRNGVIGTQPIAFTPFFTVNELCVFASCDRPTIIYMRNGKVLFNVVDVKNREVTAMASFHAELFPDCIAFCSEAELVIGVVEDIQKVHVQTVPLGEAPRRIAHNPQQHAFIVSTEQVVTGEHGDESVSRLLFFDDSTMALLTTFQLDLMEQAVSLICGQLDGFPDRTFYVVGTAQIVAEEPEPSKGRVLLLELSSDRKAVHVVTEKETRSGVYSLALVCGKLAAGIGSKVQIFKLHCKEQNVINSFAVQPELQNECSHQGHIMTTYLKSHGDFVVVGDLIRSITVLQYKPQESLLEEAARDFNVHMMRAVEVMDGFEDHYLGCEDNGNLFTVRRQTDAASDEERSKLDGRGYFHMGDYVNVLRRGTLVTRPMDNESSSVSGTIFDPQYRSVTGLPTDRYSVLYGTVSGAIGSILGLTEASFQFFLAVEKAMRLVVAPVGGFAHQDWRSFQSEMKVIAQKNVLDGDLIEMVLDLAPPQLELVATEVNSLLAALAGQSSGSSESAAVLMAAILAEKRLFTAEDIVQRVEDISRLH